MSKILKLNEYEMSKIKIGHQIYNSFFLNKKDSVYANDDGILIHNDMLHHQFNDIFWYVIILYVITIKI